MFKINLKSTEEGTFSKSEIQANPNISSSCLQSEQHNNGNFKKETQILDSEETNLKN